MDFLREEVENLKKLGYSWELEKHQIEEAIMKAIAGCLYTPYENMLQDKIWRWKHVNIDVEKANY